MKKHNSIQMKQLFTVILTFFSLTVFGTAQAPDHIIYNGKEYLLYSNPMEEYFKKYPDRRPKDGISSTALRRGYVATYEIKNNQLFLKDIEIQVCEGKKCKTTKWKSVFNEIFSDQELIKIDWVIGILILPYGKKVNNILDMGYASAYENYIVLTFENGILKKEQQFDNKEFEEYKEKRFQEFKKTEEYKKVRKDFQNFLDTTATDEYIESILRIYDIEHNSQILDE